MEWLYALAEVWHVAVLAIFLATWLYAINRGLVTIANGVVRIGQKLEPKLFGAEEITQRQAEPICDEIGHGNEPTPAPTSGRRKA